jgi:hypothetical protein
MMTTRLPTQPPERPARSLELDWDALEVAVERNASDTESFLDLATGKVVTIAAGDVEAPVRRKRSHETRAGSCGSSRRRRASSTGGWSGSSARCPTRACASG